MRDHASLHHLDPAGPGRPGTSGPAREDPPATPPAHPPSPMGGWICLRDCNLSGQVARPVPIPFALLHPDVGVALVELMGTPPTPEPPEAVLRARLEAARFDRIFPGHLPIVHLRIAPAEIEDIDALLGAAFAALPALSVPGGDAWVGVLRRALTQRDSARAPPASGQPEVPPWDGPVRADPEAPPPAAQPPAAQPPSPPPIGKPPLLRAISRRPSLADDAAPPEPDSSPPDAEAAPQPGPDPRRWWFATGGAAAGTALAVAVMLLVVDRELPPPPVAERRPSVPAPFAAAGPDAAATPAEPRPAPPPLAAERAAPPAPPAVSPEPPPAALGAALGTVTVRSPANLRTGPSTRDRVLRTTRRGEQFQALARSPDGWIQVGTEEGPQGWIYANLLSELEPL